MLLPSLEIEALVALLLVVEFSLVLLLFLLLLSLFVDDEVALLMKWVLFLFPSPKANVSDVLVDGKKQ